MEAARHTEMVSGDLNAAAAQYREIIARAGSNRAIAADLGIEYTTVRGHVQTVLEKLGARSRFDAVARAYRTGLVRDAEDER